jgi:hypothetical protein
MAWLNYEVLAFYINIVAMGVFMLLSSCKKFKSIRDRLRLLPENTRKNEDFLTYCSDDIHWFCTWFTQLMLCLMALLMRIKRDAKDSIQLSAGLLFMRQLFEIFVILHLYFSDKKFDIGVTTKVIFGIILGLNCIMVLLFIDLEAQLSVWWAPVLLLDVILHFYFFLQIFLEYRSWDVKLMKW